MEPISPMIQTEGKFDSRRSLMAAVSALTDRGFTLVGSVKSCGMMAALQQFDPGEIERFGDSRVGHLPLMDIHPLGQRRVLIESRRESVLRQLQHIRERYIREG